MECCFFFILLTSFYNRRHNACLNLMFTKQKKSNDSGAVTLITTANKTFVKKLNHIHTTEIIPEVETRSKNDATKDLPPENSTSTVHVDFLKALYDRLVVDYKSEANINEMQYNANKEISQFKRLKKRLQEKLKECRNNIRIQQRLFEELKVVKTKIIDHRKAMFGITLLSASEAIFASSSFQIFVQNLLFSLVIGLTFAVALYYSAVIGARVLKLAKNRIQFIGILAGIQIIIGSVFYTLGYFRLIFLSEMSSGTDTSYHLSPAQFMLIQLFFFTVAILLKFYFLPSREEFEQYNKWKEAKGKIDKLKKQEQHLETSIEDMEHQLNKTLMTRRTLISAAADVELKIQALYHDAYFNHYVKTNLHHRKKGIPKSFTNKDALPKLTLYFQDRSLLEFNEADLESYE